MLRKLGRSILWGVLASIVLALAVVALSMLGAPQPLTAYILSGTLFSYVLFAVVPSSFIYWLAPEGGGPAALGILLISAFIQSTVVIAVAHYCLSKTKPYNKSFKGKA